MQLFVFGMVFVETFVSPAVAHAGVGRIQSFTAGIAHPLTGADHILAMTVVGLWSVLTGGRAIWAWPATFTAAMLGGFAAATLGLQLSFVEPAICASIVVLGLLLAFGVSAPVWMGAAVVGAFCIFSRPRSRNRDRGGQSRSLCCRFHICHCRAPCSGRRSWPLFERHDRKDRIARDRRVRGVDRVVCDRRLT
ncbi:MULTISPECIES: HupE/UreJ family protein [Bradyrhizobium]|uniref:HupE/UreJ family protein n=1 Tax=Bradyrhizobium elkanii TaxID=29448 RepID=UPI003D9B6EAA